MQFILNTKILQNLWSNTICGVNSLETGLQATSLVHGTERCLTVKPTNVYWLFFLQFINCCSTIQSLQLVPDVLCQTKQWKTEKLYLHKRYLKGQKRALKNL